MRASEFIVEAKIVGRVDVGQYHIYIDQHYIDQLKNREVREIDADQALAKINQAKAKIKTLGPGQSFWMYDNTLNVSLGIKMTDYVNKVYLLKTVLAGPPRNDRNYPIFNVA